jgi:hypothetical protein
MRLRYSLKENPRLFPEIREGLIYPAVVAFPSPSGRKNQCGLPAWRLPVF